MKTFLNCISYYNVYMRVKYCMQYISNLMNTSVVKLASKMSILNVTELSMMWASYTFIVNGLHFSWTFPSKAVVWLQNTWVYHIIHIDLFLQYCSQGWTGNRAYRAFSRWADALKGPTEFFIFFCQGPSRRDSEQPVAHWFVSCIDSVNHPITMRYRQSDEVFCSA